MACRVAELTIVVGVGDVAPAGSAMRVPVTTISLNVSEVLEVDD
jgi:hypothetical protein